MAAAPLDLWPETSRDAALRRIADVLAASGVEEPLREARLLLLAALDIAPAMLIADGKAPIGDRAETLAEFATRRAKREPFARIIGRREFYGLDFSLNSATLVPRPDTETLVDAVLDHARLRGLDRRPARIIDIGTGTGAILIAALANLPQITGIGTDVSGQAIDSATQNAARLLAEGRAAFYCGAWFAGCDGPFDIIVSNPPYIPSADIAALAPEVVTGDPRLALDGGLDGLDAYRLLAEESPARLAAGGIVAVEIGINQDADVAALFHASGLRCIEARCDLGGIVRALVFEREP